MAPLHVCQRHRPKVEFASRAWPAVHVPSSVRVALYGLVCETVSHKANRGARCGMASCISHLQTKNSVVLAGALRTGILSVYLSVSSVTFYSLVADQLLCSR